MCSIPPSTKSPISTHILDTARGQPAAGVDVSSTFSNSHLVCGHIFTIFIINDAIGFALQIGWRQLGANTRIRYERRWTLSGIFTAWCIPQWTIQIAFRCGEIFQSNENGHHLSIHWGLYCVLKFFIDWSLNTFRLSTTNRSHSIASRRTATTIYRCFWARMDIQHIVDLNFIIVLFCLGLSNFQVEDWKCVRLLPIILFCQK